MPILGFPAEGALVAMKVVGVGSGVGVVWTIGAPVVAGARVVASTVGMTITGMVSVG
jgi:hypothetical protein